MAKQQPDPKTTNAWDVLDSTNTANIGGRRFYNHPTLGKCFGRVIGIPGERMPEERDANLNVVGGGQLVELLRIDRNDGSGQEIVRSYLSDDRKAGSCSLANDGDLTDAPNMAYLKPDTPAEVTEAVDAGQSGNVQEAAQPLTPKQLRQQARKNKQS
jgi:hypothetical protein